MTPDFIAAEPWGTEFFRSESEAIEYAQQHNVCAYRQDYEMVHDEHMPYEQQVRTLLWEPNLGQPRRGGNVPAGLLELSEEPEAA